MEKEYVDREELIELAARLKPCFAPLHRLVLEAFVYAMKDVPNANVAPVVHGEWIKVDGYGFYRQYECSRCHKQSPSRFDYCPNCGAKMI